MDRKKKYTLSTIMRDKEKAVGELVRIFGVALEKIAENPDLLNINGSLANNVKSKKESAHVEYQSPAVAAVRDCHNDRVFPLETVTLKGYEQKREEEIGTAVMHIGSYADEYARSFHALALTVGTDIYFRNGAYKPETEEGRKTIAHELTHVAQHKNRPLADNRTKDELEAEAEAAESTEEPLTEPLVVIQIGGKQYKLRKSEAVWLDAYTEREVRDWIEQEKGMMPDKEYAKLLQAYNRYLDKREQGRRPWTKE